MNLPLLIVADQITHVFADDALAPRANLLVNEFLQLIGKRDIHRLHGCLRIALTMLRIASDGNSCHATMKVLNVVDMHRRTASFPNAAFLLPGEQILSAHATQKVTPSHLVKGIIDDSDQLWIEKR